MCEPGGSAQGYPVEQVKEHSGRLLAKLGGLESREAAPKLKGSTVYVRREAMPRLAGTTTSRTWWASRW